MVLTNPYYALLDTYNGNINKLFQSNVSSKYNITAEEKNNLLNCNCFNLVSTCQLESGVLLKEIRYVGTLTFSFDYIANEVYVSKIPYVLFMNTKIPVFTSDIAKIIKDILIKYGIRDFRISFKDQLLPLAIDTKVEDIIPSIKDTTNYRLVMLILNKLVQEKKQIMKNTKHFQDQQRRLEESRERALTQKRKIKGLDPQDFVSLTEFQKELNQKLISIWQNKIKNIKRHLQINRRKYLTYLEKGSPENFGDTLELAIIEKLGKENNRSSFENLLARETKLSPEVNRMLKLRQYFYDHILDDTINNKQNLNRACRYILDYDLHSPKGVLESINKARGEDDLKKTAQKMDLSYQEVSPYIFYELILRDFFASASKHPIFSKQYEQVMDLCRHYQNDFFMVAHAMKRAKFDLKPWELVTAIASLEQQLTYYQNLLKNPKEAILKFYKTSKVWGSIMLLSYWKRIYIDTYGSKETPETFGLFMIQKGVKTIDYENIMMFWENPRNQEKPWEKKDRSPKFFECTRLMVTIPHSLSYLEIEKLIDYSYKTGEMLNFICEGIDVAIIVKKILIKKSVSAYVSGQEYFKNWCFVNIDPTYFESFMVDTPNSKTLWHRYDFSSDYKYHRFFILSFDYLVKKAIEYSRNGDASLDYQLLDAILLGSYDETIIKDDVANFYASLKPKMDALTKELTLTKRNK